MLKTVERLQQQHEDAVAQETMFAREECKRMEGWLKKSEEGWLRGSCIATAENAQ